MIPWEREIYLALLAEEVKKENERIEKENEKIRSMEAMSRRASRVR